jgi:hypothetical protein
VDAGDDRELCRPMLCQHEEVALLPVGAYSQQCYLAPPDWIEWGVLVCCFCAEFCVECGKFMGRPLVCGTLDVPVISYPDSTK